MYVANCRKAIRLFYVENKRRKKKKRAFVVVRGWPRVVTLQHTKKEGPEREKKQEPLPPPPRIHCEPFRLVQFVTNKANEKRWHPSPLAYYAAWDCR